MELDTAAGMVLTELEHAQVVNDTIVFLTGDNGPPEDQCDWGGSKGVRPEWSIICRPCTLASRFCTEIDTLIATVALHAGAGGAQPFLGSAAKTAAGGGGSAGKLTSWAGGHREVGVVAWPGKIEAGAVSHVLSTTMDYLPTIASLAGAPLLADRTYDGLDLSPVLFEGATTHHPHLFFSVGGESYGMCLMPAPASALGAHPIRT